MENANGAGVNTSEGIELTTNWKPKDKKVGLNFNYTFTDSYDSNNCDVSATACNLEGSKLKTAKVRVPRHVISTNIVHNTSKNLQNSLSIKFADEARDLGNTNNSFKDVVLEDYLTFNFSSVYNLFDNYKLSFNVINLFDDNYEQAHQYSTMGRSVNFGIVRAY